MSLFCVCVCVTLYRLGLWASYRHETVIIRTSMTRRGTYDKKCFQKVNSDRIIKEKTKPLMLFYGKNFSVLFLCSKRNFFTIFHTNIIKDDFPEKSSATNALLIKKYYFNICNRLYG